ncbi:MAG: class I SAM-dependent methyltransferase [Bacteroidales bacterium]|nr:class I SAM-dependent methyltransferase [Bacteroidales bacterium]
MEKQRLCPVWVAYTFLLPVRKLQHDPEKILRPYVKKGMKVMDYGCAMGYFSIPLARMTGPEGIVYCVDIQAKMIEKLEKRAVRFNVDNIVKLLLVNKNYNPADFKGQLDFILLFNVVHEVEDKKQLFTDLESMLKKGGKILFSEPKWHVKQSDFEKSLILAQESGLKLTGEKPVKNGISMILIKE